MIIINLIDRIDQISKALMIRFGSTFELFEAFQVSFKVMPVSFEIQLKIIRVFELRDLNDVNKLFHRE